MLEVFLRQQQSSAFGSGPMVAPLPERSIPFSKWRLNDVQAIVARDIPPEHQWAWNFFNGDHWQGGWGWAGPMVTADHPAYTQIWTDIMKMFSSRNATREIVETHVNGVLSRPMRWSLAPVRTTPDERDNTDEALKALIAEASAIVRAWLQQRNAHALLRAFLTDLLMPPGRAVLRLFLPSGNATPVAEGSRVLQLVTGDDFGKTLASIFAEKPVVYKGRVWTEPATQRDVGVALFRARNASGDGYQDAANITFVGPDGETTMIGTLYQDGTKTQVGYDLGGRITMFQRERSALVTSQLLQQQRILNYAESMIPRNLTTAGFLERVITSTQLNGRTVKDPETGIESFEIDESQTPRFGPAEVTVLEPMVLEDDEGKLHVTTPGYQRGEPIMPTGSIESSNHIYQNMLREAAQGHLIKEEDSDSSVIRYGLSLMQSAIPCTEALRWMIETSLAWAEALRGEEGRYTDKLRVQTSAYINVGPVTPEQRNALIAAFEKSVISRETAQELMGVEDVDSENDRIAAQPGSGIDLAIRMANAFKMLRDAGLPAGIAAKQAGYSADAAAEMEAEFQKEKQDQQKAAQEQLKIQGQNALSVASTRNASQGSAGLRAARRGRPSGTAEKNPGQGQNKGARALQNKKRNRSQP